MEIAAAVGAAWEPDNGHPGPDEEAAPEEGRCRAVLIGDDHESMRKSRGEARLAVDESRLVMWKKDGTKIIWTKKWLWTSETL